MNLIEQKTKKDVSIKGMNNTTMRNKDKRSALDRKRRQSHIEQEKAYCSLRIERPACKVMILKSLVCKQTHKKKQNKQDKKIEDRLKKPQW